MNYTKVMFSSVLIFSVILIPFLLNEVSAENIPDWIKNTALWYGEGKISETEFLNAIKFLVENKIIVIDTDPEIISPKTINVIIPNGNSDLGNAGFYLPLNAIVNKDTTVVWINDDAVGHTIQSQDNEGNVMGLFNSDVLKTGERFGFKFEEEGTYNYFCTIHPWRVGVVTVR
jgi:hypothetical protein